MRGAGTITLYAAIEDWSLKNICTIVRSLKGDKLCFNRLSILSKKPDCKDGGYHATQRPVVVPL